MLHLALASRSQYVLGRNVSLWTQTGLRSYMNICIQRQTLLSRNSITAVRCIPLRCMNRDTVPYRRFIPKYEKDKVSSDFKLIYRKYMSDKLLLMFYGVGALFAFLVTSIYVMVLNISGYDNSQPVQIPWTGLSLKMSILHISLIIGLVMSWPFIMHLRILRKEIVRIYYNTDTKEFVGIIKNKFRKRRVEFTMKDVEPVLIREKGNPDNIIIHGKYYTVFEPDFIDQEYVNLMLRYF